MASKYVREEIRLPIKLAETCAKHAGRLGITTEEYIAYVMMRSVDDHYRALDAIAVSRQPAPPR